LLSWQDSLAIEAVLFGCGNQRRCPKTDTERERQKSKFLSIQFYENTMLETRSIPFGAVPGCLAAGPRPRRRLPPAEHSNLRRLTITGASAPCIPLSTSRTWRRRTRPARGGAWSICNCPPIPNLWADKSAPRPVGVLPGGGVPHSDEHVFIPPGTFRMGCRRTRWTLGWEGPQTTVTISRGFWMGKYEVTQGEYLSSSGAIRVISPGTPTVPWKW